MKLSLCIATFNEEKFIHYPLDSAYDFVDEVIIVDGGSTDKTIEIVKKYGEKVKVFTAENPAMFHINKQKAIEKAKGEWILQLDADESVSEELREEIISIVTGPVSNLYPLQNSAREISRNRASGGPDSRHPSQNGYWIPRKNYFLGRFLMKGGVYPDYTIRLYKNGKAHFPCKTVHENVEVEGEVGYLKNPLLHYADPSFTRYLKRWQRYTGLDADMLVKERKTPNVIDYLIVKPVSWFLSSYIRHKGFLDSWQGFVFAFFSAIRFWGIYVKWLRRK